MRSAATATKSVTARSWFHILAGLIGLLAMAAAVPAGGGSWRQSTISVVSPADGQTVSGNVTWEVAVAGEEPSAVEFAIDGIVKWSEAGAPYVFNGDGGALDTTTLTIGAHTLAATASFGRNGNGQKIRTAVTIYVDNAPKPVLQLATVAPSDGQTVSGKVKWEVAATGETPGKVDFAIDGVAKWSDSAAPYVFNGDSGTLDTATLSNGSHRLTATATGPSGGTATSSVAITVSNTTATFSTNLQQGMVAQTPFEWKFTPGSAAVKGFFWGDGKLLATVTGPGPYTWTLPTGVIPEGVHQLGHSWETSSGQVQTGPANYSVTIDNPTDDPTSEPPPTSTFESLVSASFPVPAFTATRTITVTTPAQLDSAIYDLRPGDKVVARDFDYTGSLAIRDKNLSGWAEIHLVNVRLLGASPGSQLLALWVQNVSKVRLYGGDVTNRGGDGVRVFDSIDFSWRNFVIHDVAGTCVRVLPTAEGYPTSRSPVRNELVGRITNCGLDLNLDPHAEKGTGLHGAYIGISGHPYPVRDSRFALDVHDQSTGVAMQMTNVVGGEVYLRARRITRVSTTQIAGNAFQTFGSPLQNVRFRYLEADTVAGHPLDVSNWAAAGSLSTNVVEYGRATNFSTSSRLADWAWDTQGGIQYTGVQPQEATSFGTGD